MDPMDIDPPQTPVKYIEACINFGTKWLAVAVRAVTGRETKAELDAVPLLPLNLVSGKRDTPQKVAWHPVTGQLIFGHAIATALKRGTIKIEDVISYYKLSLYPNFRDSPIARKVDKQLERYGKTKLDLLSEVLAAVLAMTKAAMRNDYRLGIQFGLSIDHMQTRLLLSVPQMWNAPANWWMTAAAKKAGFTRTILVRESQCVAANLVWGFDGTVQFQVGTVFMVDDMGAGTVDIESYEVIIDPLTNEKVLRLVGEPSGGLCGSQHINEAFLKWLKDHVDFATWCENANITEDAALAQADDQFELAKIAFSETGIDNTIHLTANGKYWPIEVPSALMEWFYQPVIEEVLTHMRSQDDPRMSHIIMAGGTSASDYIMALVKQAFTNVTFVGGGSNASIHESHVICLGALHRYNSIDTSTMIPSDSFGIVQAEEYNADRHPDASYQKRNRTLPLNSMLIKGPRGVHDHVDDRWVPIMDSTTSQTVGQTRTAVHWHVHNSSTLPNLGVYWSKSDKEEGTPIYKPAEEGEAYEKKFIPDVHEWGLPIEVVMPNFRTMGFQLDRWGTCEYFVRHEVTSIGPNVSVKIDIAMPGKEPFEKRTIKAIKFSDWDKRKDKLDWQEGEEKVIEYPKTHAWYPTGDLNATMPAGDMHNLAQINVMDEDFNPNAQE